VRRQIKSVRCFSGSLFLATLLTSWCRIEANEPAEKSAPSNSAAAELINAYARRYQLPNSVRASERPFIQPEVQYAGKDGMETELRLGYSEQVIPADPTVGLNQDQRVRLRCYNGRMIGPTLRLRPGNKLGIIIKNELPVEIPEDECTHPSAAAMSTPHGWNCTNLHTHGLHVSPEGNADNVFVEIEPGKNKQFHFEFHIPTDHVCGTFWYHPHRHGSVAMQLTTGLAGALIIESCELDKVPEVRDAFERVMVFQQLSFSPDPTQTVAPKPENIYVPIKPGTSMVTLVNGQVHPVLRVAPSSVERWRFVHAGVARALKLAVVKDDAALLGDPPNRTFLPLHEIAIDGIPRGKMDPFDKPADPEYPVMYPGYRWDVLFKAPDEPGQYFLVDAAKLPGQPLRDDQQPDPAAALNYLAKITVDGDPRPMKLPNESDLAAAVPAQFQTISDEEIKDASGKPRVCAIELQLENGKHLVDKCEYDPARIDRVAWLDTAEEWRVKGTGGGHPFHIHVNPFEQRVTDASGNVVDRIWRDTLFVRGAVPSTIRMRFKDHAGKTVLHCHILDHEDQGMMENFLILPANKPLGDVKVRVLCNDQFVTQCVPPTAMLKGAPMPQFALPGTDGKLHDSNDLPRQPLVVVFFRGVGCLHCAVQLQKLAALEPEFRKRNVTLIAVSSDEEPALTEAYNNFSTDNPFPFLLLANGDLTAFKAFGCWNGGVLHGIFVVDSARRVNSARTGSEPFMDFAAILKECDEVALADKTAKVAQ
jgi:FtsP/CotA-like multicopper oxidase with cupredoxin domain/peroxiredoxin